ncbi:MAG: glycosyltransferase family 2 protein [Sedimentisphaerales bacterium]|nr:glycosyltransferase family 2 protein [Sedimentisphaerales bacterium]
MKTTMDWYYYIALAAIISQLLFLFQTYNNYRYAVRKYSKERSWYRPRTVLIVPCKGLDAAFEQNITSFFNQEYDNYLLWFVVGAESDPAYSELCRLKNQLSQSSKAQDVQVFVAGKSQTCSQKNHNLLYCYQRIDNDIDVMAFADSDICVQSNWLSHLVYPLRKLKYGAASGYRWYVPKRNNPASLALSAMNAKVAQLLGNTRFNQAWGGSMAIRVNVFRKLGLDKIWPKSLSDDLSLSVAVKKAGMVVAFVPACLAASHEVTTWRQLFEFVRRQFIITRFSAPKTWLFGLFSGLYSVLGIWAAAGLTIYAWAIGHENLLLFTAVPAVFFVSQLIRAILRQRMAGKLLEQERHKMRAARAADILGFWLWSILMLILIISSAFGRTICWRGIRYKLLGPNEIIVEGPRA